MPPVVIDLVSSPEPEESPSANLQTWRPRKRKEKDSTSGRLERQRDSAVSPTNRPSSRAAHLAAPGSELRKDEARPGSKQSNGLGFTPSGAWGSLSIAPANYVLAREHHPPERDKGSIPKRPQEGSLASLLQSSAQQSFKPPKSKHPAQINGDRNERSPTKGSMQSSPADRESERIQVLSKFQNNHAHPPKLQPPSRRGLGLERIAINDHSAQFDRTKALHSNQDLEFGAMRPFKRQRLEEPDPTCSAKNAPLVNEDSRSARFSALLSIPATGSSGTYMPIRSASPASSATIQSGLSPKAASDAAKSPNGSTHAHPRRPQFSPPVAGTVRDAGISESRAAKQRPMFVMGPFNDLDEPMRVDDSLEEESIVVNRAPPAVDTTAAKKVPPALHIDKGQVGGGLYTSEEDALLIQLKEVDKLSWEETAKRFAGSRTRGSLQVRYSTTLKNRDMPSKALKPRLEAAQRASFSESTESDAQGRPVRKRRNNAISSATDGFISWAQVKKRRMFDDSQPQPEDQDQGSEREQVGDVAYPRFRGERMHQRSLHRILRQREFGASTGRSPALPKLVPEELKERVLDSIGPSKYYKGTSGDVTCLAWAPNGESFAAGSIAISDERSMQYNRPNNLVLGKPERGMLQELPEHHIQRPAIENAGNVNSMRSMRETQDSRLFMTVASVQFSPDGSRLYSAGSDRQVRAYNVERNSVSHLYALDHAATLDLLSVSNFDILATACHQSTDKSIAIFKDGHRVLELSPHRKDEETKRAIYPSALRWGHAYRHSHFLLAGFAIIDSTDEERYIAGETCLWNIQHEARIPILGIARNVFDVAWNPSPSAGSSIFAVASSRGTGSISRGTHSVVQCFGANLRRTIGWECPAFDINDVIYCKHDDNLVAAGATDGKVYVWDQRFADRSCRPLHTFAHGDTLNVLDHELDREVADTGVRFVSWGSTRSRLYTGSSDGVLKIWNPYRSPEDAHIKDVASFNSAIMSGAFSPDDRDLLIGEDQGQINLLSVDYEHKAVRSMRRFDFQSAPSAIVAEDRLAAARELKSSGQISFRLMGDLPKRQAVQGPYYQGPYLRPSPDELSEANEEYERASNAQNEAESASLQSARLEDDNDALRQATRRVQAAQGRVISLQNRLDDSYSMEKTARANQQRFLQRGQARMNETSQPVKQCSLDCNYLPVDTDREVPDSRRSEMRIPELLRRLRALDMSDSTSEEDARNAYKCISCLSTAPLPSKGKQPLCERCYHTRNGFTASCRLCSNPMRPDTGVGDLCEKCSFACFRCGKASMVARDVSLVTCDYCELTWQAGVLGYELVKDAEPARTVVVQGELAARNQRGIGVLDELESLGSEDIEHYASRWIA